MGAYTFRLISGMVAQTAQIDVPDAEKAGFAPMDRMPKVVFSPRLTEPLAWSNTTLVSGDAIEAVRELKRTSSRPLTTTGSIRLASTLMEAGLVGYACSSASRRENV